MKYETPEMTVLTPAINAIQGTPKDSDSNLDGLHNEVISAYADWE